MTWFDNYSGGAADAPRTQTPCAGISGAWGLVQERGSERDGASHAPRGSERDGARCTRGAVTPRERKPHALESVAHGVWCRSAAARGMEHPMLRAAANGVERPALSTAAMLESVPSAFRKHSPHALESVAHGGCFSKAVAIGVKRPALRSRRPRRPGCRGRRRRRRRP